MTPAFNPKNAAGRQAICRQIAELAERYDASVRVTDAWPSKPSREAMVRIAHGPVEVGIIVGPLEAQFGYCLPWVVNTLRQNVRLTTAFGSAAWAPVNAHHRRKCTAGYSDLPATLKGLERTLQCIVDGTGYEEKTDA